MVSNPIMEYQVFCCIFLKNSAMATLGLKEMGKFLWEGRENRLSYWLSQFGKTKLRQSTVWYYEKWVGLHAYFPPRRSVRSFRYHFVVITMLKDEKIVTYFFLISYQNPTVSSGIIKVKQVKICIKLKNCNFRA